MFLRLVTFTAALTWLAAPATAQRVSQAPAPSEIVAAAPASDWVAIAPADLLVMDLVTDAKGRDRRVVIQLMPPPFSAGWVANIRTLAKAHWWDGTSINRVQDNYVAQWGDPDGEDVAKAKPLPPGLVKVSQNEYTFRLDWRNVPDELVNEQYELDPSVSRLGNRDKYAGFTGHIDGWPIAGSEFGQRPASTRKYHPLMAWPVHCYAMVGVGRGMPPDTGTGAELYTVIGHAPRHLDRNIALVGRVIEGIENLSSLPRGKGPLGFYDAAQGDERVPILRIRLGDAVADLPSYEYLSPGSAAFARYADARANRRDPFFITPAGGADVCNIPVPVRRHGTP